MCRADSRKGSESGKLRLMYEANLMGFIVEQAGGVCHTSHQRIMEVDLQGLRQRVPVIPGSRDEVECVVCYHQEDDGGRQVA